MNALNLDRVRKSFFNTHARTSKANKNVFFALLLKGTSIVSQLLLVPLTLDYLDKTQYGIWITLSSIMGWFSFFDIGIGNGLRNKLSEALAVGDEKLARIYISTSYAVVAATFFGLMIIFWIVNPFLNWQTILNVPPELSLELSKVVLFVFTCFCLQFILNLLGSIFFAKQLSAFGNSVGPIGNIFSIIIIFILTKTTAGSLYLVAATFSAVPVFVLLVLSILFFKGKFRSLIPSLTHVDLRHSRSLIGLGFQFLVIQIAALVLFTSSNMVLSHLFGPGSVSEYNVAYRYFTVIVMIQGIITTPYWSAITEAYFKNDFGWIRKTIRNLEWVSLVLIAITCVMLVVAGAVYDLWIGGKLEIAFSTSLMTCLFVIISVASRPYNTFLNGIGKVKLQLYSAVVSIIITVPLAIFFASTLRMGPAGVVLATVVTTLPTAVLWRIQYKKIINGTATGIWRN